jgi:hypothetical protein
MTTTMPAAAYPRLMGAGVLLIRRVIETQRRYQELQRKSTSSSDRLVVSAVVHVTFLYAVRTTGKTTANR